MSRRTGLNVGLRLDGVAGERVRVVEVEQPAAHGRGHRVHVAPLVGRAVGERGVEREAVAGGEQRAQLARRAAPRTLALHGDDARR